MAVSNQRRLTSVFKPVQFRDLEDKTDITIFFGPDAWREAEQFEIHNATTDLAITSGIDPLACIDGVVKYRPLVVVPGGLRRNKQPILASKETTSIDVCFSGDVKAEDERKLITTLIEQAADNAAITLSGKPWEMVDIMREHLAQQQPKKAADPLSDLTGEPEQEDTRNPGNVAAIMQGTKLGQYAIQVADSLQMPRDTTVLTALGVVSAPVSMLYSVAFEHSGKRPASLYVVCEQPPSSGKSEVLARFTRPIQRAISEMNKRAYEANEQAGDDDPLTPTYRAFITDTTPEALEKILIGNAGHFCLASAEQALVNTALGLSYGGADRKNNNDLILKGYGGEWHHSARASRAGFEGDVFGSVTVVAQPGTIDTILEQSNGTGIAERFLMLSEPTLLGYRDHTSTPKQPDQILETAYSAAMADIIGNYEKARECGSVAFDALHCLHLARSDWDKLRQRKQELEPKMADGGRYSHNLLRGVVGKYDQRVMKLAAPLHVVEHLMDGQGVPDTIHPRFVAMAMQLADLSLEQVYQAMNTKGLIGLTAEQESIYRIVSRHGDKGVLWNELRNAAKGVQPFKSYPGKGLSDKIRDVCRSMWEAGTLECGDSLQGGRTVKRYYAL